MISLLGISLDPTGRPCSTCEEEQPGEYDWGQGDNACPGEGAASCRGSMTVARVIMQVQERRRHHAEGYLLHHPGKTSEERQADNHHEDMIAAHTCICKHAGNIIQPILEDAHGVEAHCMLSA